MQQVSVAPYNPTWPTEFARESASIAAALGDLHVAIHHIGSTSIPGMDAKPIIDIIAVVTNIDEVDGRNAHLQALGYVPMGEFGIPARRFFRKDNSAGHRTHHIHAFQRGSPQIDRHLAFRDFMIAHPDYAQQYATLKRRLAAAYPTDIEAYMDGKDEFIQQIDAQAAIWRQSRDISSGAS
jgi:GrpB-like predicted nucleotidyltransferase (UPF0157 family)